MRKKEHICKFCKQHFDKGQALGGHIITCKKNPNYEKNIKQIGDKIRKKQLGKPLSEKHKASISKGMKLAVKEGRQKTLKPGGITKGTWFENIENEKQYLHGSWEVRFAEFLNQKTIKWEKSKIGFKYLYQKSVKRYFPDFYLKDFDFYVEVKGYETEKDREKWRQFPFKLLIVKQKEISDLENWYNENIKDL